MSAHSETAKGCETNQSLTAFCYFQEKSTGRIYKCLKYLFYSRILFP